jgi:2-oxoisovalerate dehydrogenase E2 component (dihydrolipoyl transacylase)
MAQKIVKLPDVGEGVAEAEVVEWAVSPGDTVREDQMLGAVMTDKATVEIPSPASGRVVSLGAELGSTLAVGADFVVLEVGAEGSDTAPVVAAPAPAVAEPTAPSVSATSAEQPAEKTAEPAVSEVEPQPESSSASAPQIDTAQRAAQPVVVESGSTLAANSGPVLAAPAVRHRARALGIDLSSVEGSGTDGQIRHADLDVLLAQGVRADSGEVVDVPLVGLRRQIAKRMQQAKQTIPHFTYVEEVDVTELSRLREHLKALAASADKAPTLLPFLIKALVVAVADYPQMNARFNDDDDLIQQYADVHVGLATQTPAGLMVPVIRNAGACSIDLLSEHIRTLAAAARDGTAARDDLMGSTITISSLGPLGGIVSTPVINQPEVAIIGVNKIVDRPQIAHGMISERKMMNLSCSFDHRAVDGYDAAQFVQRIKTLLEYPATIFM